MKKFNSYIELITQDEAPIIVYNGFALMVANDDDAITMDIESVGMPYAASVYNYENLEPIKDALTYMMEHPGEDNNLESVASNLKIIFHERPGVIKETTSGILFNANKKTFYFVGMGCDSPYIELVYNYIDKHVEYARSKVVSGGLSLPNQPLPSGFESEEDERFLKAIPHYRRRKNLKLRSAFDYVSSGIFVFAYTKEEEKYIHDFARITGISDVLIKDGMYEFYPYVTIKNRNMVPVRQIDWDNVISAHAMLKKMQKCE